MINSERLISEAAIWANLDGCEGADFLGSLCDALSMVHYSYAKEPGAEYLLQLAIMNEIEAHKDMALGPCPGDFGYDEESVTAALDEIAKL